MNLNITKVSKIGSGGDVGGGGILLHSVERFIFSIFFQLV